MSRDVAVTLLETSVLGNIMEIISTENDGAVHLVGNNNTTKDTSADGHISGPGALLVDVLTLDGGTGSLESQTDVLVPSGAASYLTALNMQKNIKYNVRNELTINFTIIRKPSRSCNRHNLNAPCCP